MKRITLRRRVGRLLGQWSILILVVLVFGSASVGMRVRRHTIDDRLQLARTCAYTLDWILSDLFRDLQRLEDDLDDLDRTALEHLRALRFQSPFRKAIFVLDGGGEVLLADPEGAEPPVLAPLGREGVWSVVTPSGRLRLLLLQPFSRGSERLTLVSEMDPRATDLTDLLEALEEGRNLRLLVVDDRARVVLSSDETLLLRRHADSERLGREVSARRTFVSPSSACLSCEDSEEEALLALVPLRLAPLGVVVEQSASQAFFAGGDLARTLLPLVALLGLGGFLLSRALSRSLVEPIASLSEQAAFLHRGDLSRRIEIEGDAELRFLGETLEAARTQLESTLSELRSVNEELEERVAERTAESRRLLHRLLHAGEDERKRIARELHDEISQLLTVIRLSLDESLGPGISRDRTFDLLRRAQDELRRIIFDLRPSILDDVGLPAAIRWHAERHLEKKGLELALEVEEELRLRPEAEIAAFRIFQECVTNVLRHAEATSVSVEAYVDGGRFVLAVEDDGVGFDLEPEGEGVGLVGMRERAALVGGTLRIDSEAGSGTSVILEVPLE